MTFAWSPLARSRALVPPSVRHVLYYFDGPKMVVALDSEGRQVLGVAADEDDDGTTRWVFAPAPPERLAALLRTGAGLRALFQGGPVELHDLREAWESVGAWSLASDDVPEELLPDADAELPALTDDVRTYLLAEQAQLVEQRSRVARTKMFFSGAPVHGRRGISAAFAADAIAGYQHLVSLAYGHRRRGGLSSTGPIPEREGSALLLTDMPRGSVGFELVEDDDQARVLPTDLSDVVAQVGALLDAAAASDAAYAETVAEFDRRVVEAMHGFLSRLRNAGASMRMEVHEREYVFTLERLTEAADRASSMLREEADRPLVGKLIGFLPTDRRFELETRQGVVKGRVSRDANTGQISQFFMAECTAHLSVIIVERLAHTTEAFTLVGVEPPRKS